MSKQEKNPNAVALGHLGGSATAKAMSKEQRKAKMRAAAIARWERPGAKEHASKLAQKNKPWEKRHI